MTARMWASSAGPRTAKRSSTCGAATWSSWGGPTPIPRRTPRASIKPSGSPRRVKRRARSPAGIRRWFHPKAIGLPTCSGGQIWLAPLAGGSAAPLLHARDRASRRRRSAGRRTGASSLCQRPRQSQLYRGVRFRLAIAELSGSQRGPGCQPRVVARRQAGRVHTHDERDRAEDAADGGRETPGAYASPAWPMERGGRSGSPTRVRAACFAPWLPEDQLVWTGANRLVFPWERDGWTHLYSVPDRGRHGYAADARRVRSGARHVLGGRQRDRLLVEPGDSDKIRPAPHLAGDQRRRASACRGDGRRRLRNGRRCW